MATIPVEFYFFTGLLRDIFANVRLEGSWDAAGRYAEQWTTAGMQKEKGEDGCPCFHATVLLDASETGRRFSWGVRLDGPLGQDRWGITTESDDLSSQNCVRTFVLQPASGETHQVEKYYLTHCRRLGAQKLYLPGQHKPGIRFSVWAPNARNVEVVFGVFEPGVTEHGYIADDGTGIDTSLGNAGAFPMQRDADGVWQTDVAVSPEFRDFARFDHKPYIFRITKDNGRVAYRADLYSRCQIGKGRIDPQGKPYQGGYTKLDGTVGCSVVIDPETVTKHFEEAVWPEIEFLPQEEFWKDEFTKGCELPTRIEDLVIYELHVGSLGFGQDRPGNFGDVIDMLDYLVDLGVNAVELMPVSEFEGDEQWGYGTSHYFALEYSAGGRDQLTHLIRECHRYGLAVILDVVYNHYHHHAERAEWAYDSDVPDRNIYYWYEGNASDYPDYERVAAADQKGHGGYVDNDSTGYAPRYDEEMVRKMFISSAVALVEEFHIDGFRVDQTTSIHSYNKLHADGRVIAGANSYGAKFLRELARTLKTVKPGVLLIAEDHSEWDRITAPLEEGGVGFDAAWYVNFYHHLIGDGSRGTDYARLLYVAGRGDGQPLALNYFEGAMMWSRQKKVVYHESHDEAGNSENSQRTIVTAVNGAPLIGDTRRYAEARCRFVCGMSMLSLGTPMFLMGEEVGAQHPYRYKDFMDNREDLRGERRGNGQRLFKFYQDLISLRLAHKGLRSHNIDVVYSHNINRVLVFRRWDAEDDLLIAASLHDSPFGNGYTVESPRLRDAQWKEMFNSDAGIYGGANVGNRGMTLLSKNGRIDIVIPMNGFVVLQKA